jgi:predicted amidohydrolase YtcJ
MTHEYTLLVGGTVLPGAGRPAVSAMAWALGTLLVVGTDAQVLGVSRGDSLRVELHGEFVVPIGPADAASWPPAGTLEIGDPADFAVLLDDPRVAPAPRVAWIVRGGHVVRGTLQPAP